MWLAPALTPLVVAVAVVDTAEAAPIDTRVHAELSQNTGWSLSHRDGEVEVYRKTIASLGQTAWMGVTVLPAAVKSTRLFAVIGDTESHKGFTPSLAESVVMDRTGGVTTFYQVVRPPAYVPVSERWWMCRAVESHDVDGTSGHLRRRWSSVSAAESEPVRAKLAAKYPDALLLPYSHGSWDLEPQPDGTTKVTYRIVTDPGGSVPRGLATRFAGRSVADNMRTMIGAAARK